MLRRAGNTTLRLRSYSRCLHNSNLGAQTVTRRAAGGAAAAIVVGGAAVWYSASSKPIYNDAALPSTSGHAQAITAPGKAGEKVKEDPDKLQSFVWGSNSNGVLNPDDSQRGDALRTPTVATWLDDVALRDLQFQDKYGACIDARGDVYQWGDGFFGVKPKAGEVLTPKLTLRGKNITQLRLTEKKLYALSASGKVYVLAADLANQELQPGRPTPASDSWWGTGWLWGEDETVDFAEVLPAETLARGESFTSISAGKHHLLALTSKGRVFAHPVNKNANQFGQLGFSKFHVPDPSSSSTHLHVQLTPKSLADPFVNASRAARVGSSSAVTSTSAPTSAPDNLAGLDDSDIRFCRNLFEIPVLKGVEIEQIAAGAKTSFARTPNGKVLAWGANDHGQLGLGGNVTLDTITVPTEVILWRFTPHSTQSKCLDVTAGGDLTAFLVERHASDNPTTVDLLMSGDGQFGGLGNSTYSNAQSTPTRVKAVSGLLQYNDNTKSLEAIRPDTVSISPSGHVLVSLNSATNSWGGKDVMVWGKNYDSELGNGKKGSIAQPITLEPSSSSGEERVMLVQRKAKEVKDLHGKVWKCGVKVEQRVSVGPQSSAVYWRIV